MTKHRFTIEVVLPDELALPIVRPYDTYVTAEQVAQQIIGERIYYDEEYDFCDDYTIAVVD